jgi:hypothetical protein
LSTSAGSHHSMPESVTAITVEGRPAVVCQAVSTLLPSTPQSSWGLPASEESLDRALVSFTLPPPWLQLAGRSGIAVAGVWGLRTQAAVDVPTGGEGHGNCPIWVAVPEPVFGSVFAIGHDPGRESVTADGVGSVAFGSTAVSEEPACTWELLPAAGEAWAGPMMATVSPDAVSSARAPTRATSRTTFPPSRMHDPVLRLESNGAPSGSPASTWAGRYGDERLSSRAMDCQRGGAETGPRIAGQTVMDNCLARAIVYAVVLDIRKWTDASPSEETRRLDVTLHQLPTYDQNSCQ